MLTNTGRIVIMIAGAALGLGVGVAVAWLTSIFFAPAVGLAAGVLAGYLLTALLR